MPFNGSGTFQRVYNWVTDKNNSVNITASRVDTEDTGFATGLTNCICKDGQTTITANLPMATFRHTGVGDASARTHYAVVGQIQDSIYSWIAGGGTADAITGTYSPAVTALVDGMELNFRSTAANATTTPTFAPNGLTAHTITKNGGSAVAIGDIPAALFEGRIRYNLANTRWELQNPAGLVPPFSDANAIIKGSVDATKLFRIEVDGFTTGNTRVMTPPDADFTAVGLTNTQALTNKTLQDSTCTFVDDSDATKKLALQCSGITTGTTRTVTAQNVSGTMALIGSTYQASPADPTGTANTTGLMMGLAGAITPATTGKIMIVISGDVQNSVGGSSQMKLQGRYGTGAAPANAAALTGTTFGGLVNASVANNGYMVPFSLNAIVSGLSVGTAYWVDIGLAAVVGGTTAIKNVSISIVEI